MVVQTLAPQDLARKVVTKAAQLRENKPFIIIETVASLKKQRARPNRNAAKEIVMRAKSCAEETRNLSHEELIKKFSDTLDAIGTEAIKNSTATEEEWERD